MIGLIGIVIVIIVMVAIKLKDDEIRKNRFLKSLCVYSWLLGIVLFLIQVINWIVGSFD